MISVHVYIFEIYCKTVNMKLIYSTKKNVFGLYVTILKCASVQILQK